MRPGYYAYKKIIDCEACPQKLRTALKVVYDDHTQEIWADENTWVYCYLKTTKSTYPLLCTVHYLIETAVSVAFLLKMSPEDFKPVGDSLSVLLPSVVNVDAQDVKKGIRLQ